MRLGWLELVIIVAVILLLFGTKLIPKMIKNGKDSILTAKKEIESAKTELEDEFNSNKQSTNEAVSTTNSEVSDQPLIHSNAG